MSGGGGEGGNDCQQSDKFAQSIVPGILPHLEQYSQRGKIYILSHFSEKSFTPIRR